MQCTLMPPHRDGHCDWCGMALTGKRRRWCSEGCMREFRRQHDWDTARDAALIRDGHRCQQCGVLTVGAFEGDWALLPSAPQRPRWEQYDSEEAFQRAIEEWSSLWKMFVVRVVKPLMPEVNHKMPLVGQGYAWGCMHHAENLETLCHRCHVQVTKRQRAERKMANAKKVYEKEIHGRRSGSGTRRKDGPAPRKNVDDSGVGTGETGVGHDQARLPEAGGHRG